MVVQYRNDLKRLSRVFRKKGILSEVLLWEVLKGKKIRGFQFTRQKPIDKYIADFYCPKLKLAIEIDGNTHNYRINEDIQRQKDIENLIQGHAGNNNPLNPPSKGEFLRNIN